MKKISRNHRLALAAAAALGLALSPSTFAQTASTDTTQNSKAPEPATSESASPQTPTSSDATNSKDLTKALDKNPSSASTDSSDKSATKAPNSNPTDEAMSHHKHMAKDSDDSKPMSDNDFIAAAAQGGMTEVELGKLAQEKASSSDVKDFGSHMVEDHSKANDELKSIAEKKGITVKSKLDARHQAAVDRLSHLSGAAFDRAYVRAMVRDHENDASAFREESTSGQDPDVKQFAGTNLKMVESHLSMIKNIQSQMK